MAIIYKRYRLEFNRTLFGKLVREAREQAGLSRREFAEMIGKSHAFVSAVERGDDGYLTINSMLQVVNALELRVWNYSLWYLAEPE